MGQCFGKSKTRVKSPSQDEIYTYAGIKLSPRNNNGPNIGLQIFEARLLHDSSIILDILEKTTDTTEQCKRIGKVLLFMKQNGQDTIQSEGRSRSIQGPWRRQ